MQALGCSGGDAREKPTGHRAEARLDQGLAVNGKATPCCFFPQDFLNLCFPLFDS